MQLNEAEEILCLLAADALWQIRHDDQPDSEAIVKSTVAAHVNAGDQLSFEESCSYQIVIHEVVKAHMDTLAYGNDNTLTLAAFGDNPLVRRIAAHLLKRLSTDPTADSP